MTKKFVRCKQRLQQIADRTLFWFILDLKNYILWTYRWYQFELMMLATSQKKYLAEMFRMVCAEDEFMASAKDGRPWYDYVGLFGSISI